MNSLSAERNNTSSSAIFDAVKSGKRPSLESEAPSGKRAKLFKDGEELPICAVCLGRHPHRIIECTVLKTWNQKFDTFARRENKALLAKDGRRLCTKWQQPSGCQEGHVNHHVCSGCGSPVHGASRCSRAQRAHGTNPL